RRQPRGADHRFLWSALHQPLEHVRILIFSVAPARDRPRSSDPLADHKKRSSAPRPARPRADDSGTWLILNSTRSGVRRLVSTPVLHQENPVPLVAALLLCGAGWQPAADCQS